MQLTQCLFALLGVTVVAAIPTNVKPTTVKATNLKPTTVKAVNLKPTTVKVTNLKPTTVASHSTGTTTVTSTKGNGSGGFVIGGASSSFSSGRRSEDGKGEQVVEVHIE